MSERILEIGCGSNPCLPRSFAPGGLYIASDVKEQFVASVGSQSEALLVCADGEGLPFQSNTFDYVLAKDVFGDPTLGKSIEDVHGFSADSPEDYWQKIQQRYDITSPITMFLEGTRAQQIMQDAFVRKTLLLMETARILQQNGTLIIIETRTPEFAEDLLQHASKDIGAGKRKERLVQVSSDASLFSIRALIGYGKQRRYCSPEELENPKLRVWLLQKDVRKLPNN